MLVFFLQIVKSPVLFPTLLIENRDKAKIPCLQYLLRVSCASMVAYCMSLQLIANLVRYD